MIEAVTATPTQTSDSTDSGNPVVGAAVLGGLGYGGYRLIKQGKTKKVDVPPADVPMTNQELKQ
jgi:hypothetical protein